MRQYKHANSDKYTYVRAVLLRQRGLLSHQEFSSILCCFLECSILEASKSNLHPINVRQQLLNRIHMNRRHHPSYLGSANHVSQTDVHEHIAAHQSTVICVSIFHFNEHGVVFRRLQQR